MDADHKRAISAGVSRFMQGEALRRQCPACGRRAALGRRLYSELVKEADGHWCLYSTARCRWCHHEDIRPCPKCGATT